MRRLLVASLIAVACWAPLSGVNADPPLTAAALAWDKGDYLTALTTYLQILESAEGDAAFETIALQTGELFQTVELTRDGDAPRFSPDARLISYETGSLPHRRIRLLATGEPSKILAEFQGHRGMFSPDGKRFAYLRVLATPELERAAEAVDAGPAAQRTQRLAAFNAQIALAATLVVRDLGTGTERELDTTGFRKTALAFLESEILFSGSSLDGGPGQIYAVREDSRPVVLTTGAGEKVLGDISPAGTAVTFTIRTAGGGRGGQQPSEDPDESGARSTAAPQTGRGRGGMQRFGLITLPSGRVTTINGSSPAFSRDSSSLAYVAREGAEYRLMRAAVANPVEPAVVRKGIERLDSPAFSSDGSQLAYQLMPKEDWEIFAITSDGTRERRITREIQHDLLPRFVAPDRMIAMIGEARHRRSYLYDLSNGRRIRLFHNNTVRTIAPEYAWIPSSDGRRLLIVAERDGDTVSPERGVYLVNLEHRVTKEELKARLRENIVSERALRTSTLRMFAPIAADVRKVVGEASIARVFGYQKALFDFDSKHVTQPGNKLAAQYLFETYKSFGYQPEFQEFDFSVRGQPGGRTANVLATLKGNLHPELVYVVSSHYDSVAAGPGADDDSSGTAALLETARILAGRPQSATIVFASFTGEEAGLLGSRQYVRQAVANGVRLVGALNNDMIGWANDHRLDNTIRYSNPGIRDVQHGAAMHFTNLITYDALYYKSTDAAAYYEAFGDIVGGIGSYPVLGNPHYHQPHDVLETMNHQLITEVAKTTAASLMLLASSPSRLTGLEVDTAGGVARVRWTPSPERDVTAYIVRFGHPSSGAEPRELRVKQASAVLPAVNPGMFVSVKAVNARGLEGWDWARVVVR